MCASRSSAGAPICCKRSAGVSDWRDCKDWKPGQIYADFIVTLRSDEPDCAEFVPAMRNTIMRFEIVDEDEWEKRLNAMFAV